MTYQETVEYLFARLPMFSRIGAAAIKKDLTNTIALCDAIGNPQHSFKTVHIAGTNGKGSTSHMLAAILQSAGYTTGLYTSPHLYDFRERIRLNGKLCEESFVVDFTRKIQPLIDQVEPSFFEITVAMAFEYFAAKKVDIAIIETGLGGRLDSTNIITPELSIITNIGWDHMQLLGDTLEKIAFEKAGIIKPNVPVVIGETGEATKQVFINQANALNAPLSFADDHRYIDSFTHTNGYLEITVDDRRKNEKPVYTLDLPGIYQTKNLLGVLESVHQLQQQGFVIEAKHIHDGLQHTKKYTGLHGRWETISHHPRIIVDVAHNVDGMKQLVAQLELETYHNLHIVIGMVKDKDVDEVLRLLPHHATYSFTKAQIPRALPEEELQQKALSYGLKGKAYASVELALNDIRTHANPADLVLVCGSVFLVAEVKI